MLRHPFAPELAREIGDREQAARPRHRARRTISSMPWNRVRDRVVEARAPGLDQLGMLGELRTQLGRGLRERTPGVVLEMPFLGDDVRQKRFERLIVLDQALVEVTRIPFEEDLADIEDDGVTASPRSELALAGLEPAIRLVDHIGPAAATDHAVVAVPPLERLQ
jgi:hypothetical protein